MEGWPGQWGWRKSALILRALILLAVVAPALVPAASATDCASETLATFSHTPTAVTPDEEMVVSEDILHSNSSCTLAHWAWKITAGQCWNAGSLSTYSDAAGAHYVLRWDAAQKWKGATPEGVVQVEFWAYVGAVQDPPTLYDTWTVHVLPCAPLLATDESPRGTTFNPEPAVSVLFSVPDPEPPTCLPGMRATMTLDSNPVSASLAYEGNAYLVSYAPATPLIPGPHSVQVSLTSGGGKMGAATWGFFELANPTGPTTATLGTVGLRGGGGTPGVVTVEPGCIPRLLCLDPQSVETPATGFFVYDLEPTEASVTVDPFRTNAGPFVIPNVGQVCPQAGDCPAPFFDVQTTAFDVEFGVSLGPVAADTGPIPANAIDAHN